MNLGRRPISNTQAQVMGKRLVADIERMLARIDRDARTLVRETEEFLAFEADFSA